MTRTRWLIVLFWVFVVGMLIKQCHDYTEAQIKEGELNPPRQYFFTAPPPAPPAPPPPPAAGGDVRQISFKSEEGTPGPGSFTCLVTLRNEGLQTARSIQVRVRPYRGVKYGTDGEGHVGYTLLQETDPLSQYGTWIGFPDLKPGETATESAVFLDRPNVSAGFNPQPEITFETAK
jgi:hypothetical protein